MDKETLIEKWLNNELSPAEKQKFEQGDDFAMCQSIIDTAQHFKASQFSEPDTFKAFHEHYKSNEQERSSKWSWKPFLRIASVIIIALGVYFTFFNTNQKEIQTLASQHSTIALPDKSEVILNADSKIIYDADAWSNERSLSLDGEAYFKVSKGQTFDVVTTQGTVTVIGTEFNVKARPNHFEVMCFEGVVSVTSGTITEELRAGETFRLLDTMFTQDKTLDNLPQWTQNKSVFKALPLKSVLAEMERQYDIKITVRDVDTERLFTGGFIHNDLENALLSVTQPMNLHYTIKSSKAVVIYGRKN